MKNLLVIICIFLFIQGLVTAQNTKADIQNVNFTIKDKKIIVTYDIVNYSPIEKFITKLRFYNDLGTEFIPVSIAGDASKEIAGGAQKQIVWDVMKDSVNLVGRIKATVEIEQIKLEPKGATSALYSLLVPGLGDRYVVNTKLMTIKPVYKAVAAYGCLAVGIYQKSKSDKEYNNYEEAISQDEIDQFYDNSNKANKQYLIFTAAAGLRWGFDVGWVLAKGLNKEKNTRTIGIQPAFTVIDNKANLGLGLSIRF